MGTPDERRDAGDLPPEPLRDPRTVLAIAVGGSGGATLRWVIGESLPYESGWPSSVFVVNIVGCALLGWLVGRRAHLSDRVFAASALGFCGALTTFSTFAVDLAVMARSGRLAMFAGYLIAALAGGLLAFIVGRRLGERPGPMMAPS